MTFCALLVPRKAIIERDDRAFSEVPLIQHRHFLDLARDWIFAETLISITFAVYMEKCMDGRDAKKRRLVGTWVASISYYNRALLEI